MEARLYYLSSLPTYKIVLNLPLIRLSFRFCWVSKGTPQLIGNEGLGVRKVIWESTNKDES